MKITNGNEIRRQIRMLGYNQKEFAEAADVPYGYLNSTINGIYVYKEVLAAFDKHGIRYERKPKKKLGKVA